MKTTNKDLIKGVFNLRDIQIDRKVCTGSQQIIFKTFKALCDHSIDILKKNIWVYIFQFTR